MLGVMLRNTYLIRKIESDVSEISGIDPVVVSTD
jgi:hypothetical protein